MKMLRHLPAPLRTLLRPHPGWYALLAALALVWIGVEAIRTTELLDSANAYAADKQAKSWLPIALLAMGAVMIPKPRLIGLLSYPLMALSLALLVMLLLPMPRWLVPMRNGATAWINLYFMSFQPSEMAKIAFVLSLAWYLRFRDNYRTFLGMLLPFVLMFVPVALILKEPDLGTAIVFAPTVLVMLVAAGAKLRHLGALITIGVAAVVINVVLVTQLPADRHPFLKEHQANRIKSMISLVQGDDRYLNNIGYQQDRAMQLVGSGGVVGYGLDRSAEIVHFNHLPHDHNDMIFAVIVNRWGFAGALVTLGLYLVLILSFVLVAARSKDPFARLATVGFGGVIFSQAIINIGMTVGLLPITGITLPFISYGGSSLMMTFIMVGLVLNFAARRPAILARPSFEFDPADLIFR